MTTAATSLLGLALPVTGELSGTWGDTVNNSITSLLDSAVAGTTTLSTDGDVTLTTTTLAANQARQAILLCSGARTAIRTITAPAQSKIYTIINATTGGYAVKIVGVGPTTGISIPAGQTATVAWNGSDFVDASNYTNGNKVINGNLSVTGSVTLSAGTANGVAYLNGSKVVTTGSALTFDGTNLGVGGSPSNGTIYAKGLVNVLNLDNAGGQFTIANWSNNGTTKAQYYWDNTNTLFAAYSTSNTFIWTGSSEQMRLTSTSLYTASGINVGIGTSSPSYKLDVRRSGAGTSGFFGGNAGLQTIKVGYDGADTYRIAVGYDIANEYGYIQAYSSSTTTYDDVVINPSGGNLGLGVTPSAWASGFTSLEWPAGVAIMAQNGNTNLWQVANAYYNGSWTRKTANPVAAYNQSGGVHSWYNAGSGAAGSTFTFTQAMTLDASGNLAFRQASSTTTTVGFQNSSGTQIQRIFYNDSDGSLGIGGGTATAYPLKFFSGNTQAMTLDASGNLGVGTTSPSSFDATGLPLVVGNGSGNRGISIYSGTTSSACLNFAKGTTASDRYIGQIEYAMGDNSMRLYTNATERARIDSSGNLLVGTTSALGSQLGVQAAGGNGVSFTLRHTSATAGKFRLAGVDSSNNYLVYNNSNVGMYMTDGGTSWTATSDETQKILTSEFTGALDFISGVRATRGRYISDDETVSRSFLIAQDWQNYLPEAISEKDGILGLSYQDTIPVLIAAIKEQQAIIEQLKARLDAANL